MWKSVKKIKFSNKMMLLQQQMLWNTQTSGATQNAASKEESRLLDNSSPASLRDLKTEILDEDEQQQEQTQHHHLHMYHQQQYLHHHHYNHSHSDANDDDEDNVCGDEPKVPVNPTCRWNFFIYDFFRNT